jgi:phosphatidylglycerophosphatase A
VRKALLSIGVGLLPGIPGTYGSAVTAGVALLLHARAAVPLWLSAVVAVGFGVLVTLALAAPREGEDGDPSWVVTDEVAGQGIALLGAAGATRGVALPVAVSFVLFRILDVVKPGPVGRLERLPGAVGVLADDLAAGALAAAGTFGTVALLGL